MGNVYSTLVNGLYREFPKYVKLPPNSTLEEARNSEESRISVWRLVRLAAISAAGFAAISHASPLLLSNFAWYRKLPIAAQSRLPTYVTSLVHAALGTGFSVYKLLLAKDADNGWGNRQILCVTIGYFLNDLWDTRHVWMAHKPDLMHHIMGVLICSGCIASTAVNEFIPRFLIVELSTLVLDLMHFMKEAHYDGPARKALTALFVLSFFATRIAWMPVGLLDAAINHTDKWNALGPVRWLFIPVQSLQFYWFFKIVAMIRRMAVA